MGAVEFDHKDLMPVHYIYTVAKDHCYSQRLTELNRHYQLAQGC